MERIGILGGTFDPPHLGHLIIANEVYHEFKLNKVLFLPAWIPPHKESDKITDPYVRLELLKILINKIPYFEIDETEIVNKGKIKYTYDTVQILKEKFQDDDLYFIIGADQIEKLDSWHKIDQLQEDIKFVGVNRKNYSSKTIYNIQHIEIPTIEISSTLIKNRLRSNKDVKFLVPDEVFEYIREKKIYG
ncbi:MAG: nicotinate (nicotinamide) nucleotide adenylyltransferase [Bacillales bacterium]|jgi:nicotinate-nucleotide adenylyltransferase|nr:nicotinate (nicotinamide) nucleotide adenylyltransferase [Bacillales bacterium]